MFNNLIGRTETFHGVTDFVNTQHYAHDGTKMVLAFDGSGNLTDRYLWGPAVDQVLADEQFSPSPIGSNQLPAVAGNTLWTLGDNQNSIRDMVNDSGALVEHVAYNPFGQQVQVASSYANQSMFNSGEFSFGYTGTYTDSATADQLHGVRWYDPASQRWLTQDPAAADSNLYRYCGNAPEDGTDPSGLADVTNAIVTKFAFLSNSGSTPALPHIANGMADFETWRWSATIQVPSNVTEVWAYQNIRESFTISDKNGKRVAGIYFRKVDSERRAPFDNLVTIVDQQSSSNKADSTLFTKARAQVAV